MRLALRPILPALAFGFALLLPSANISAADDAEALPVAVPATESAIRYIGRFDLAAKGGPRCSWSASTVALKFHGADLNVRCKDDGQNRWQVEVDGKPTIALQLHGGEHAYRVASGLGAGDHVVRLVKATEAMIGPTQILGFQLSEGGKLLPLPPANRRIEVIGDSISCGYGNEGANQNEHFTPKTENAYFTYGAIAARTLGADYTCIAWSGRKMWPNFTMPEIYDLTIATDPSAKWSFSTPAPKVVLINLSTNDFGKGNPEEAGWTGAYKEFIARLRKHYPDSLIYCATSPMMGDWGANKARTTAKNYLTKIVADLNAAGDAKVRLIEFAAQDQKNGIGADWHPSIKTQEVMGEKFAATIREDLHWQVPEPGR